MADLYEDDAKKRVSELGQKEILHFLEKVPPKHRDAAFSGLRPISGFRKDEPAELKERIKKLALSLSHGARASERDWNALGHVWAGWGQMNYTGSAAEAFRKFSKEKSTLQEFTRQALGAEDEFLLCKEDIEDIFRFSPFSSLAEIEDILKDVPLRKDLEKRRKLAAIPSQLTALKQEVELLSKEIKEQEKTFPSKYDAELERIRAEMKALDKKTEALEKREKLVDEMAMSQHKALMQSIEILSHGHESIAKKISGYEAKAINAEKLSAENSAAMKVLEGLVKGLQKSALDRERERNGKKQIDAPASVDEKMDAFVGLESVRTSGDGKVVTVDGRVPLMELLSKNYLAIGIASSSAKKLALGTSTAICAGQFVQFSGALADVVADATLHACGNGGYLAWDVPAGLCDGEMAKKVALKVTDPKADSGAVLLRGMNKSSFDIYGYSIRKIIVDRLLGIGKRYDGLTMVGTWLDSNSSLPERDSLAELGPLYDTDRLVWAKPKGDIYSGGLASREVFLKSDEQAVIAFEDISDQVMELPFQKSELWRRGLRAAAKGIATIPGIERDEAFEVILLNWVLPWVALKSESVAAAVSMLSEHVPEMQSIASLASTLGEFTEAAK